MTIHLVSRMGRKKLFAELKHSSNGDHHNELVAVAPGKLCEALDGAHQDSFFYLDAASFSDGDLWAAVRRVHERYPRRVGVFDPEGLIHDPARVFFLGGADYITKSVVEETISSQRFAETMRFVEASGGLVERREERGGGGQRPEASEVLLSSPEPPTREIVSGRDWSEVRTGEEYTFWFLYAKLDESDRYAVQRSDEYAEQVDRRFRDQLLAETGRFGGRVWMWKRFSGLLLFPYDGKRCMPIIPVFRLFMNRVIHTVERSTGKNVLSFRVAVHVGNTEYRAAGDTGEVVSEDVNFVYHLGERHTGSGEMTITRAALSFVPEGLQRFFVERGPFEGHETYAMHRFVPGSLDL